MLFIQKFWWRDCEDTKRTGGLRRKSVQRSGKVLILKDIIDFKNLLSAGKESNYHVLFQPLWLLLNLIYKKKNKTKHQTKKTQTGQGGLFLISLLITLIFFLKILEW